MRKLAGADENPYMPGMSTREVATLAVALLERLVGGSLCSFI